MMKKNKNMGFIKKLTIIFLVFALICIIPCSFAMDSDGDVNLDNQFLSSDSQYPDEYISANNFEKCIDSKALSSDHISYPIAGVDAGKIQSNLSNTNYNDLKNAIDDADSDVTLYIGEGTYTNAKSGDYDLVNGEANTKLNIKNKNITFIGQGQDKTFIDGSNTDWLFNLTDSNVVFKDLSFVNSYSSASSVISSTEGDLTLINCTVKNNIVNSSSYKAYSPIYFSGGYFSYPKLNIMDCSFTDNLASNKGGALTVDHGTANITGSAFTNNTAKYEDYNYMGGAIFLSGNNRNVSIDNCIFTNNSGGDGGSIGAYYGGNLSVSNSKFYNSTASGKGGAIYSESFSSSPTYVYLSRNTFENCIANSSENNVDTVNSIVQYLEDNATITADYKEAIVGSNSYLQIFIRDKEGNNITGQLEVNLTSSTYRSNQTIDFEEGIAYLPLNDLPIGIYEAIFTLKSDIYTVSPAKSTIKIVGDYDYALIFDPLNDTVHEGEPYIVYGYVRDALGQLSNRLDGMTIYIKWEDIDGHVHSLTGGSRKVQGNLFTFDISELELVPTKVYDIEFELQNTDDSITVENGHFYANYKNKLPDDVIDVKIIYVDEINGNDETGTGEENRPLKTIQVALNLNSILGGGKTVYLKRGYYNISTFTIKDDVTVIGEDKENVIVSQEYGHKGMFLINDGLNVEFSDITFTGGNNTVVPYGAVFSNYYNSKLVLNNSIFHNNSGWYGGVINNNEEGSILIIDNCNFYDNRAQDAGVLSASNGFVYIYNSNFTNNQAQYLYASNKTVNGTGGAINLYGYIQAYIDNCKFEGNKAPGGDKFEEGGGAIGISADGYVKISNSSFVDNYAAGYGGAIWTVHGTIDIIACIFVNNTADREGTTLSAYYNNDTIVNLTNSVIITGDVPFDSHVVYAPEDTMSIVYADNNWWGLNRTPSLLNVNMSSRIVFSLYNNENYDLVVALKNNDGSDFEGYLPERTVMLTPADKFDQSIVKLGNNVNSRILKFTGDITEDSISATMDKQTLYFNYKHYPDIETQIKMGDISAILNSTVSIQANVSSNGTRLNESTVSFFISQENGEYEYLGDANVTDGIAAIDYLANLTGEFDIQALYNGDDYYKPSVAYSVLRVSVQIPTKIDAKSLNVFVDDAYTIKLTNTDNNAELKDKQLNIQVTDNINKKTWNITNQTDVHGLVYLHLASSNYTIKVQFNRDNNYLASNATANVLVSKYNTFIEIIQKNNTGDISISLSYGKSDKSGSTKPLSNKTVQVSAIDGKGTRTNYELKTNYNGLSNIKLDKGNYFILANFTGDEKFLASNSSTSLLVEESSSVDNGTGGNSSSPTNSTNGTDTNGTSGNNTNPTNGTNTNGTSGNNTNPTNGTNTNGTSGNNTNPTNGTNTNGTSGNNTNPTNGTNTNGTGEGGNNGSLNQTTFTSKDLQKLIDKTQAGSTLVLSNVKYENVSNIKINKNITIIGEKSSIISAGDGNPIFILSPISEGLEEVKIKGINFLLDNGDTVILAKAENGSNPLSIETAKIDFVENNISSLKDNFVGESVNLLVLQSERSNLAPTNPINISGNTLDYGINPFKFEITSISNSTDAFIPSGANLPEKQASAINYKDMLTVAFDSAVDGRIGEYFNITLTDSKGNPLANKFVQIGFNGAIYNRTTNENGKARLQINLGYAGRYTFAVSFLGDDDYNGSFIVALITVNKQKAKLTAPNKTYKSSTKTKTLTATFKTRAGKAISGKKISFTVNGKTYTGTSNSKGVVSVKVSLSAKKSYSFTAKYAGDNRYAAISVKGTVKIT